MGAGVGGRIPANGKPAATSSRSRAARRTRSPERPTDRFREFGVPKREVVAGAAFGGDVLNTAYFASTLARERDHYVIFKPRRVNAKDVLLGAMLLDDKDQDLTAACRRA
jgi:hypothetical protein